MPHLLTKSFSHVLNVDTGAQPLVSPDETIALAVNGEIYNHKILRKQLKTPYGFKTHSDCEVIIPLVCAIHF
jgi:asparagine synthase (glutamine-hydrolysing)